MSELEDRVRESLRGRAGDVRSTPALWAEVDRRITRRRRRRVAAWSLAGVAVALAAFVLVPNLLTDTERTVPEIEPIGPAPDAQQPEAGETEAVTPPREPSADEGSVPSGEPDPHDPSGAEGPAASAEPLLVAAGNELRLVRSDGVTDRYEFPAEGESTVVGLAVRPGSTTDDVTAVALTTAEGMWDLREIRILDGVFSLEVFPEAYRPGGSAGAGLAVKGPVFSPDGDHLAWFELGPGSTTVRTIGWDDGPGTGDEATDNAAFSLETASDAPAITDGCVCELPMAPVEWVEVASGPGATEIRAVLLDGHDAWLRLPFEGQADGALSRQPDTPDVLVEPGTGDGAIVAVASVDGGAGLSYLLQETAEGPQLVVDPSGESRRIALPGELTDAGNRVEAWIEPVSEGAVVGAGHRTVAHLVGRDGSVQPLEGAVSLARLVR